MREWCYEVGLSACTAHGLGKACARTLAEAKEIGAVTGQKPLALLQRYTEIADREGMTNSAIGN